MHQHKAPHCYGAISNYIFNYQTVNKYLMLFRVLPHFSQRSALPPDAPTPAQGTIPLITSLFCICYIEGSSGSSIIWMVVFWLMERWSQSGCENFWRLTRMAAPHAGNTRGGQELQTARDRPTRALPCGLVWPARLWGLLASFGPAPLGGLACLGRPTRRRACGLPTLCFW